jgi:hypothetical protein
MSESPTLAEYLTRPHTSKLDFGAVKVNVLAKKYQEYRAETQGSTTQPEHQAIEFYLLNSAAAMILQQSDKFQPLSQGQVAVMDAYYQSMQSIGHRAFFYLLLICTRESRHCKINAAMEEACNPLGAMIFWNKHLKEVDDSDDAIKAFLQNAPECALKDYTEHLVQCFVHGGYKKGFAGEAWAAVAKPLRDFVNGVISMEMLIDTVWTLAHNNGPIFNKGMLFKNHLGDGEELRKILNVQRAGQMANLVEFKESKFVTADHLKLLQLCQAALPDLGGEAVNWKQVTALGAVPITPAKIKVSGGPLPEPVMLQITPTEFVKKITRKETKK